MRLSLILVLGAMACARTPAPLLERSADLPWESTPLLPSPDSGTYATSPGKAHDGLVRFLTEGKAYDRALEAAAAGLALAAVEGEGGLDRWELREAAWRGGWPYPILEARGWSAVNGEAPPDDVFRWLEALPVDHPMALVRARGRIGDGWVGLRALPEIDLGTLPRAASLGAELNLPAVPGALLRVSDGGGGLLEAKMDAPQRVLLTTAGEWILQVVREGVEIAKIPIYVEIEPPNVPLLDAAQDAPLIGGAEDADRWTRTLLKHVRTVYRLPAWDQDPLLDAAVRKHVEQSTSTADLVASVGLNPANTFVWTCDDVTVEHCLDRWVWDPRKRQALLSTRLDVYGLHTALDARGLRLTMIVGSSL